MRELTKSMLGLSWAVSVFGAQQIGKAMASASSEGPEALAAQVDEVTRTVQAHLSEAMASRFRSGDQWQRKLIDSVWPEDLDAGKVVKSGVDVVRRSIDTVMPKSAGGSQPAASTPAA
jgi:hypothetical protein